MNLEQAQQLLVTNRKAHWNQISDLDERRKAQNFLNKFISRWKFKHHPETVEDYCILLSEIEAMQPCDTEGRPKTRENRPKRGIQRSKRRTSQRLALKNRRSDGTDLTNTDVLLPQDHDFLCEQLDEAPTTQHMKDVADGIRNDVLPDFSIDQHSLGFRTGMDNNTENVFNSFSCLSDPPDQSQNVQPSANAGLFGNLGDASSVSRECRFDANIPIESSVEIHKDFSGLEDLSSFEHAQPTDYPGYHTQYQLNNYAEQNSYIAGPQISGKEHTPKAAIDWCSLMDFTTESNGRLKGQSPETLPEPWNCGIREQDTEELDDIQHNGIVCHSKATVRERFGPQPSQEEMREGRSFPEEKKNMVPLFEQGWEGLNAGNVQSSYGINDAALGYSIVVERAWEAMKASHYSVTSRARVC